MIEARGLTKRYGAKLAVDDLTFTVRPGVVTGFLGPNGAGKSTTMRMIIGLDAPTSGRVTVNGKPYAQHSRPLHEVGALLEARAVHTGRSARNHLLALAARLVTTQVTIPPEKVGAPALGDKFVAETNATFAGRLSLMVMVVARLGPWFNTVT